jgi:hypothetical protein
MSAKVAGLTYLFAWKACNSASFCRARDVPASCIGRPEPRSRQSPDTSSNVALGDLGLHKRFAAFLFKRQGPRELDVSPSPVKINFDRVTKASCGLVEVAP